MLQPYAACVELGGMLLALPCVTSRLVRGHRSFARGSALRLVVGSTCIRSDDFGRARIGLARVHAPSAPSPARAHALISSQLIRVPRSSPPRCNLRLFVLDGLQLCMLGQGAAGTTHTSADYKQQIACAVHAVQGAVLCLQWRELVPHPHFFPMSIRTTPPPPSPRADADKAPRPPVGPVGREALDQRSAVTDIGARGSLELELVFVVVTHLPQKEPEGGTHARRSKTSSRILDTRAVDSDVLLFNPHFCWSRRRSPAGREHNKFSMCASPLLPLGSVHDNRIVACSILAPSYEFKRYYASWFAHIFLYFLLTRAYSPERVMQTDLDQRDPSIA
jgi:hypothetical protein